jgi:uncharacterized protein
MIIDLSSVRSERKKIERTFGVEEIDLDGEDVKLTAPVEVVADISKIDKKTSLGGTITTAISRDCTRCLEPVTGGLMFEFATSFLDAAEEDAKADAEVDPEDLDVSLVEDGKVSLADIVREQILLALPIQNFCREDCKGLCQKCGANLNLIDCKCSGEDIDPRWAALKSLK